MTERPWGKSRLRRAAEKRGYAVSNQQLDAYVDEGLIPPGEGPKEKQWWPPEVVEMLISIRALGETVRPLARRVITLYGTPPFEEAITAERLRAGMMRIVPSIENAEQKMAIVHAAALKDERKQAVLGDGHAVALVSVLHDWQPPSPDLWAGILSTYPPPAFAWIALRWYTQARTLIAQPDMPPFEETVTMLAVRGVWAYTQMIVNRERESGMFSFANDAARGTVKA